MTNPGALPGPVVCVCGPTASGKSALAERVALRLGADVISVDAMQVYRGMDVGTAKTPASERRVPLQMVDVADPTGDYSVALFQRKARRLVDDRLGRGLVPILCGGTGLYLDAVIDELAFPAGSKDAGTRARYEMLATEQGAQAVWELLRSRDAASAEAIHPNNVRRVVRALEMLDEGTSYANQREHLRTRPAHYDARIWAIAWDRDELYRRIDRRVDLMVERGLMEEVRGLAEQGLARDSTAGQAIGYKELLDVIDGTCTLEDAIELVKRRTRRYAKRQLSWLRRDGRARWIDHELASTDEAVDIICADALGTRVRKED